MGVLLVAGVLKAYDAATFAESLATWQLLPQGARPALAVVVPAAEIGLALAWFINLGRLVPLIGALLLLIAFTGAYVVHLLFVDQPLCGCLGVIAALQDARVERVVLLSRNLAMLACLTFVIFCYSKELRTCRIPQYS